MLGTGIDVVYFLPKFNALPLTQSFSLAVLMIFRFRAIKSFELLSIWLHDHRFRQGPDPMSLRLLFLGAC